MLTMATYTYSVVGAGSTSDNPVTVYHDCGIDTVQICWTGRLSTSGKCGEDMYFDEEYCDSVTVPSREDSSGSITWTNPTGGTHTIYYASKLSDECPTPKPPCGPECLSISSYVSPAYIQGNSGDVSIYYDSVVKCYGRATGVITSAVTFSEGESAKTISFSTSDNCNDSVTVYKAEEEECSAGCKANVSVSVNRKYVPSSGTSISGSEITFTYKKVVTDDECRKRTTNGMYIYDDTIVIDIPECSAKNDTDFHCCHDHYVDMDIPVSALSEHLDVCDIYYNGDKIDSGGTIQYRILQKAKTSGECSGVCEERTTYCVDSGSVKVCYEDGYLTNKWLCSGDTTSGCDCTSLSISGFNGYYAVPYTGGRIKVTWDYSAHTITPNCTEFDVTGGTWEEIITIGGCDERPISCDTKYNKIIYHDEQDRPVEVHYDDTTYENCEICDSECCYNYDGSGTCKCVILFKEQTPGCTTCDSAMTWDSEEERNIVYNKIRYEFVQDCNAPCDYHTVTVYSAQTYTIKECDYSGGIITAKVPYSSTTEYTGMGCPPTETKTGTVDVSVKIPKTKNSSHMDKVIYEDDMLRIVQKSGSTCVESGSCDCDDLVIDFPDTPKPIHVKCDAVDNPGLNKFLSGGTGHNGFNNCVKDGLKITATDTKCTYTVLDTVYQAVTANTDTNNSTSIAWALAEMLTELTPSGKSSTKYFEEANTYGGVPDLIGNQAVYNKRLNGAIVYTKLRYDKFDEITAMATKSRNELTSKGVTEAKLISPPGYTNRDINVVAGGKTYNYKYKSFNFPRNSLIDVVNNDLVPDKTTEHTIAEIAPIDKSSMVQILTNNETKACSDKFKNAYYDNFFCSARLYEILNGKITDYDNLGIWLKFYDDAKDPQDAILNGLKYKRSEGRLRPMDQIVGFDEYGNEIIADRVSCQDCDDANFEAEVERIRKLCDDTDTCLSDLHFAGDKYSYPSGHSGKAYIAGLAYLEATGKNKMSRMDDFSFNRAIIRAHWVSDTIAGKVLASMAIGVLNGTKEFLDEVSAIRGDTPTPPGPTTDCICTDVKGEFNYGDGAYDSGETTDISVKVGSGRTGTNCSGVVIKATKIKVYDPQNNDSELPASSAAVASIDDVRVDMSTDNTTYIIKAKMRKYPDTTLATTKTRIYFNVLEYKDSTHTETEESYINIYQKKEEQ